MIASKEDLLKRITINPDVCHGKPTVRNMRYPVAMILDLLSAGMTFDELMEDYPALEVQDILACLSFAARMVAFQKCRSTSSRMKFLVDAQLPFRLAKYLQAKGHDALHTDGMPDKERTSDSEIRARSKSENRIVVSKDKDFLDSHFLKNEPAKLLLVSSGNIVNKSLLALFEANWTEIENKFQHCDLLELTNTQLIAHGIT